MRNLIGMSVLASLLLVPGSVTTAQAGASVSVSFNVGTPFSAWCDDDLDWDNAIMIDNSRVGFWVMLPSGRWVLRCRSMWWNASYDDWCFGPWYYDYSIAYCNDCRYHFHGHYSFPVVMFHNYMYQHCRPWYTRHFTNHNGRYVRNTIVRHREPVRVHEVTRERTNNRQSVIVRERVQPSRTVERKTVIVKESRPEVRANGGTRDTRVTATRSSSNKQPAVTRSSSSARESGSRNKSVTKTETRRNTRGR
jgi:hypothetical protein